MPSSNFVEAQLDCGPAKGGEESVRRTGAYGIPACTKMRAVAVYSARAQRGVWSPRGAWDGARGWYRFRRARRSGLGKAYHEVNFYSPSRERDLALVNELGKISGTCRRGSPGGCRPASVNSANEAGGSGQLGGGQGSSNRPGQPEVNALFKSIPLRVTRSHLGKSSTC